MDISVFVYPPDENNRKLVSNVHPLDWVNPEPAEMYNIVVIGAGTAGLVTAAGAAGLGARVALVERRLMGGDCLNAGCVPSKGIIRAARAVHDARAAASFGASGTEKITADFGVAMERMRRIRADISVHDSVERFRKELGVDVFFGHASFTGRDAVDVGGRRLRFRKAAICTGGRASPPLIPGIEDAGYLTNETVFSLTELPSRLAVIGGGPVGCELSQAFARFGSEVTTLETAGRLMEREDSDAADIVKNAIARDGVRLALNAKIINVRKRGREKVISAEIDGNTSELVVDEILAGTGRMPNVEGLKLEAAGVEYNSRQGVIVNDLLQTTNHNIYAAGDICFPYKFTHTADALARIVIANSLFMSRQKTSDLVISWCIFTDPELAHVGMSKKEAEAKGFEVSTLTVPLGSVDRALLDGESDGFARVHLRKGNDRILGATIVARHAGEMINELSLAITAGLGLSAIGGTIHPYPTQAEAIKRLADVHNRTRLTPLAKKLLTAWLRWRR